MLTERDLVWTAALNVVAWLVIQFGLAWGLTQIKSTRFNIHGFLARTRKWERAGRFYEQVFGIKRWKHRLPDAASWFRGGVAKACLPSEPRDFLETFARETWRGELVHWLALLAVPVFCIWNPGWAFWVNAGYASAANLPCILAQRYNRARLQRLLAKRSRGRVPRLRPA